MPEYYGPHREFVPSDEIPVRGVGSSVDNAIKVSALGEACGHLKDRMHAHDGKIDSLERSIGDLEKQVTSLRTTLSNAKWLFGLVVPLLTAVATTIVEMVFHHH